LSGEASAAGVRFGAGSVLVKDCYRHNSRRKRNIYLWGAYKRNAANDSALQRVEQWDEILLREALNQNFGSSVGGV
jgi:hypothetical protein